MSAPLLGRIGGTRAGVWVIGNLISPFSALIIRMSGGRVTLTGKPVLLLTAIGRRSDSRERSRSCTSATTAISSSATSGRHGSIETRGR